MLSSCQHSTKHCRRYKWCLILHPYLHLGFWGDRLSRILQKRMGGIVRCHLGNAKHTTSGSVTATAHRDWCLKTECHIVNNLCWENTATRQAWHCVLPLYANLMASQMVESLTTAAQCSHFHYSCYRKRPHACLSDAFCPQPGWSFSTVQPCLKSALHISTLSTLGA